MAFEFDPNKVSISLGTHIETGYSKDTFATFEFDNDQYNLETDAHGNPYWFKTNDYSGTFTLILTQGSPTNDVLSNFSNLDRQGGAGIFPLTVKDNNSDTLFSTIGARVVGLPTTSFGTTNNDREWRIRCTNTGYHIGGFK